MIPQKGGLVGRWYLNFFISSLTLLGNGYISKFRYTKSLQKVRQPVHVSRRVKFLTKFEVDQRFTLHYSNFHHLHRFYVALQYYFNVPHVSWRSLLGLMLNKIGVCRCANPGRGSHTARIPKSSLQACACILSPKVCVPPPILLTFAFSILLQLVVKVTTILELNQADGHGQPMIVSLNDSAHRGARSDIWSD